MISAFIASQADETRSFRVSDYQDASWFKECVICFGKLLHTLKQDPHTRCLRPYTYLS